MLRMVKQVVKVCLGKCQNMVCKYEYKYNSLERMNERPVELAFVFNKLGEIYPRNILDVGTGTTALPHLMHNCGFRVTATDNIRDYWPAKTFNRHYYVIDDDITATRLSEKFDLITCISVLEHMRAPDLAVKGMFSLLQENGYLILTFPFNEKNYVRNVYELPGSSYGQGMPYIAQSFSRSELQRWVEENAGTIIDQEYWQCWKGGHWTVGEQLIPPKRVSPDDPHQLSCVLIQKMK